MSMRVGVLVRIVVVLFVTVLGLTACSSDPDPNEMQESATQVSEETASKVPETQVSEAEIEEPADAYVRFVAAVQDDDLSSFTAMLAPGFAGLEAESVDTCEYGEYDPDTAFGCLSAAAESGELTLAPEPEWTMSLRDGMGQEFSGSELDAQVTATLDAISEAVGVQLEENNVRVPVAPQALPDGSDLLIMMVMHDAEWKIFLIEQG